MNWDWNQYKAAGKHVASFAAGAIGGAALLHFITPEQAVNANGDVTQIMDGFKQILAGGTGLAAIFVPIYTAWKAAHNVSPTVQAQMLVATANDTTNPAQSTVANTAIAKAVLDSNDLKLNGTISAPMAVVDAVPSAKVVVQ